MTSPALLDLVRARLPGFPHGGPYGTDAQPFVFGADEWAELEDDFREALIVQRASAELGPYHARAAGSFPDRVADAVTASIEHGWRILSPLVMLAASSQDERLERLAEAAGRELVEVSCHVQQQMLGLAERAWRALPTTSRAPSIVFGTSAQIRNNVGAYYPNRHQIVLAFDHMLSERLGIEHPPLPSIFGATYACCRSGDEAYAPGFTVLHEVVHAATPRRRLRFDRAGRHADLAAVLPAAYEIASADAPHPDAVTHVDEGGLQRSFYTPERIAALAQWPSDAEWDTLKLPAFTAVNEALTDLAAAELADELAFERVDRLLRQAGDQRRYGYPGGAETLAELLGGRTTGREILWDDEPLDRLLAETRATLGGAAAGELRRILHAPHWYNYDTMLARLRATA